MRRCIHALIHYRRHGVTVTGFFVFAVSFAASLIAPAFAQNPVLRDIEIRSFLGEPLNLRIALAASTERASNAICQSVIDGDRRENALRSNDLVLTMVELRETRYLQVRSRAPFNEPVARFSLRIGCPGEPIVDQEFTALLDPPPFVALPLTTPIAPVVSPIAIVPDASGDAPPPVKSAKSKTRAKPVVPASGSWSPVEGDTLAKLAKAIHPKNRARQRQYIDVLRELNPQLASVTDDAPLASGTPLALPDLQTLSGIMPSSATATPSTAPKSAPPAPVDKAPPAAKAGLSAKAVVRPPAAVPAPIAKPPAAVPAPAPAKTAAPTATLPPAKAEPVKPAASSPAAPGGAGFQLRLSGAQMDLTRSRNVTNEQRSALREKQLILDSDDQVAALLSLKNTVKQLEQRLNEMQLKTSTATSLPPATTKPAPPVSALPPTPPVQSLPTPPSPPPATTKAADTKPVEAKPAEGKAVESAPAAAPPTVTAAPVTAAPAITAPPAVKTAPVTKAGTPASAEPSLIDTISGYLPSPLVGGGIVAGLLILLGAWAWSRRENKPRFRNSSILPEPEPAAVHTRAPERRVEVVDEPTPSEKDDEWVDHSAGETVRMQASAPAQEERVDDAAERLAQAHVDAPVVFDDTPARYELDSSPATTVDFLVGMDEKLPEDRVRRLQYMHERYPELQTNTVSIDDADSIINAARLYYDESDQGSGADKACELLTFAVEERPQQVRYWLAQFEIFRLENRVAAFSALASKFHVLFSHTPAWPKVRHIGHELDPGNTLFAGSSASLAGESRFDPIAENWLNAPMDFTSDALMSDLRLALLDDHAVMRGDFESITARLTASAGAA